LRNVSYDSLNDAILASPGVFAYQVWLKYYLLCINVHWHETVVPSVGVATSSGWRFPDR
jgi:hypothetical protein